MPATSSSRPIENLSAAHRVTLAIQAAFERGVRPWAKPWDDTIASGPLLLPRRANGAAYRGMNVVALWAAANEAGFTSPYWFTFKQAQALGAQVRKGERGSFVVFYKEAPAGGAAEEEREGARTRRILRGYVVFNRAQIDKLGGAYDPPPLSPAPNPESDPHAVRFENVPASVRFGGARAFYAPATDHVQLPPKAAFPDATRFYATYAHELGHWTRHPSRLDRDFGQKRFGDHGYALEELVAELCAAFVGAVIGLPADHIEDHASYIAHWLTILKNDRSLFLTAAGKAQLAADYLLHLMGENEAGAAPSE